MATVLGPRAATLFEKSCRRVQKLRHRARIVVRIGERRRGLVIRIADHERHALLGRWRFQAVADGRIRRFGQS
jgi:hypothetical protein